MGITKGIGCFCIFSAVFLFGNFYSRQLYKEYEEWCQVQFFLKECLQNQRYGKKVFPQFLNDTLLRMNGKTQAYKVLKEFQINLEERKNTFQDGWITFVSLLKEELKMNESLRIQLMELGEIYDQHSKDTIEDYLKGCIERLEHYVKEKEGSMKEKRTVGISLSCMAGMLTILLLI